MTYDDRNDLAISKLDPAMQHKVRQLLDRLELVGEDVLISSGYRTKAEQDALYAQGRTTPGNVVTFVKGGNSVHNYGCAIDFVPVTFKVLKWGPWSRYAGIAAIAKECGFAWPFPEWDIGHLEYTDGVTLADLKKGDRPDEAKAKRERKKDIEKRLRTAERAENRKLTSARKNRLTAFANRMRRILERL